MSDRVRVALHEPDLVDRELQNGRDDLGERGLVTVAVRHPRRVDGCRAIEVDLDRTPVLPACAGCDLHIRSDADSELNAIVGPASPVLVLPGIPIPACP